MDKSLFLVLMGTILYRVVVVPFHPVSHPHSPHVGGGI